MMVSHQESYSAVGLYNRAGGRTELSRSPNNEVGGAARFFWSDRVRSAASDQRLVPRLPTPTFRAIRPPRNEKGWLDPTGGWASMPSPPNPRLSAAGRYSLPMDDAG